MITTTATITAKATEVTALQAKNSINDGDNGWQIANDCIDSIFSNGGKIISPALTKAGTTSATYLDNTRREIAVGNLSKYNDNISAVIQFLNERCC